MSHDNVFFSLSYFLLPPSLSLFVANIFVLSFLLALAHKLKYLSSNASACIIICVLWLEALKRVPCMLMCGFAAWSCFSIHRCGIQRIYQNLARDLLSVSKLYLSLTVSVPLHRQSRADVLHVEKMNISPQLRHFWLSIQIICRRQLNSCTSVQAIIV